MRRLFLSLLVVLASLGVVEAQTVGLGWDPVVDTDLASYVVYRGTTSGTYNFNVDVGNVVITTQTVPLDCTTYFFAIKAKDTAGNQSTNFSNQVSGFARVRLTSSVPSVVQQGQSYNLTIAGANFQAGTVSITGTGVTLGTPVVTNCNQITLPVTVAPGATIGNRDIEFVRSGDLVFGTGIALISVTADTTAPAVPTNLRRTEVH